MTLAAGTYPEPPEPKDRTQEIKELKRDIRELKKAIEALELEQEPEYQEIYEIGIYHNIDTDTFEQYELGNASAEDAIENLETMQFKLEEEI